MILSCSGNNYSVLIALVIFSIIFDSEYVRFQKEETCQQWVSINNNLFQIILHISLNFKIKFVGCLQDSLPICHHQRLFLPLDQGDIPSHPRRETRPSLPRMQEHIQVPA